MNISHESEADRLEDDRRDAERREQNRRSHPRWTPDGTPVPDRRSGERRQDDDPGE